ALRIRGDGPVRSPARPPRGAVGAAGVAAALTLGGVLAKADASGSSPAGSGQNGTGGVTGPYAPGTPGRGYPGGGYPGGGYRAPVTRTTWRPSPISITGDHRETSREREWGPPSFPRKRRTQAIPRGRGAGSTVKWPGQDPWCGRCQTKPCSPGWA